MFMFRDNFFLFLSILLTIIIYKSGSKSYIVLVGYITDNAKSDGEILIEEIYHQIENNTEK